MLGIWKKKQATNNHQANGSVKKVTGKSVLALAESTENRKAIKVDAKNGTGMEEANLRMKHLKASLREPGSLPSRGSSYSLFTSGIQLMLHVCLRFHKLVKGS